MDNSPSLVTTRSPSAGEARLPASAIAAIEAIVGPRGWSVDPDRIAPKVRDWRGKWQGHTPLLVLPATAAEAAAVVGVCAEFGVAIVPQGGNTGLVGGSTPFGEILLSTDRMRAIRSVDTMNDSLVVEAGAPLAAVHEAAAASGRVFPLHLGSQGTATIGGLISTNAGGVHVVRYGMMRDLVLGIEAVLPDGRTWSKLRGLRKDNTGYDLKHLFIGAEGTLGVVTAACLKLFAPPASRAVAIAGITEPQKAPALLRLAKDASGGAVAAFELMPAHAIDLVLAHVPDTRRPLESRPPWLVLLEIEVGGGTAAVDVMETTLEAAFDEGLITDASLAASEAQAQAFWKLRETIPEAERATGPAIKHDISVAISAIPEFLARADERVAAVAPGARVIAFGHVGDGNVHYNVGAPPGDDPQRFLARTEEITAAVHEAAHALGGSISAEHGLGTLKAADFARRDPVKASMMRAIKAALDPHGIMNPRAVIA